MIPYLAYKVETDVKVVPYLEHKVQPEVKGVCLQSTIPGTESTTTSKRLVFVLISHLVHKAETESKGLVSAWCQTLYIKCSTWKMVDVYIAIYHIDKEQSG